VSRSEINRIWNAKISVDEMAEMLHFTNVVAATFMEWSLAPSRRPYHRNEPPATVRIVMSMMADHGTVIVQTGGSSGD